MAIQIEIQEAHIQLLTQFYINRLRVLKEEITEREQETKEINSIIQKLRQKNIENRDGKGEKAETILPYSDRWPWVKKVQYAIEYQGKPLTTKDIVDTLTEFESSFLIDRKRVVASISSILSSKSGRDKEFLRMESESGDFAYIINTNVKTRPSVSVDTEDDDRPF